MTDGKIPDRIIKHSQESRKKQNILRMKKACFSIKIEKIRKKYLEKYLTTKRKSGKIFKRHRKDDENKISGLKINGQK